MREMVEQSGFHRAGVGGGQGTEREDEASVRPVARGPVRAEASCLLLSYSPSGSLSTHGAGPGQGARVTHARKMGGQHPLTRGCPRGNHRCWRGRAPGSQPARPVIRVAGLSRQPWWPEVAPLRLGAQLPALGLPQASSQGPARQLCHSCQCSGEGWGHSTVAANPALGAGGRAAR